MKVVMIGEESFINLGTKEASKYLLHQKPKMKTMFSPDDIIDFIEIKHFSKKFLKSLALQHNDLFIVAMEDYSSNNIILGYIFQDDNGRGQLDSLWCDYDENFEPFTIKVGKFEYIVRQERDDYDTVTFLLEIL